MGNFIQHLYNKSMHSSTTVNLSLVLALTTAGLELGRIGRDSFFINTIGASSIPYMYMIDGVFMALASMMLSRVARNTDPVKLSRWLYLGAVPLATLLWLSMFVANEIDYLAYIIFSLFDVILLLLLLGFWGLAAHCFTAKQGKEKFPVIGSCGLLGTCIGALGANQLITFFNVKILFLIWAVLLFFSWLLLSISRTAQKPMDSSAGCQVDVEDESIGATVKKSVWDVPLIRTLTYMSIPLWIIIYVIEFYYLSTMERVFDDQDSLAHFLSMVVFISTLIGFIIQVFVTPKLLKYMGVGATNLIYHCSLTAGATSLLVYSMIPESGDQLALSGVVLFVVLSRFCDVALFFSVYDSSSQLLYYSLPSRLMQRGQIFITGMVVPVSTVIAGSVLVAFEYYQMPIYSATFMAVMLGFMLLIISLNITPEYLSSLIANVSATDTYKQQEIRAELKRLELSDARYVLLQGVTSTNVTEAKFALDTLWNLSGKDILLELPEDLHEALNEMQSSILLAMQEKLGNTEQEQALVKHINNVLHAKGV